MKILIFGATGFIGNRLFKHLQQEKHQIGTVGRNKEQQKRKFKEAIASHDWSEIEEKGAEIFKEYDVLINLSGANIAKGLWTKRRKKTLRESRVKTTRTIVNQLLKMSREDAPRLLNTSAVGVFGVQKRLIDPIPDLPLEQIQKSYGDQSFLQKLAFDWEFELIPLEKEGYSFSTMRFGVVLGEGDGMFPVLKLVTQFGANAVLGNGSQPMNWVHLKDLISAIQFIIEKDVSGPVNIVSPEIATNKEFSKVLARKLKRPLFLKVPRFVISFAAGQLGDELLLGGQNAYPELLLKKGFEFKYKRLGKAFKSLI